MAVDQEELKGKVVDYLYSKKGHIADLDDVLKYLEQELLAGEKSRSLLNGMSESGSITIAGDSIFLNDERYLPKVKCLICDGIINRSDLVPFYREKYYPFVNWGFHRQCLENGALEEMLGSGMFRMDGGDIYPNYEYGEGKGKNPVTIAIKYLRSDDFLYTLELKNTDKK